MPSSYRKKPLAQLGHGTRIYAPSPSEQRYRVVANDPVSAERIFVKCRTEEQARAKARELEQFIAQSAPIRDPHNAAPRTVERLAVRYAEDHLAGLSVRFREKQEYLLRRWVLPRIGGRTVTAWTPADSSAVIAAYGVIRIVKVAGVERQAAAANAVLEPITQSLKGGDSSVKHRLPLTSQLGPVGACRGAVRGQAIERRPDGLQVDAHSLRRKNE